MRQVVFDRVKDFILISRRKISDYPKNKNAIQNCSPLLALLQHRDYRTQVSQMNQSHSFDFPITNQHQYQNEDVNVNHNVTSCNNPSIKFQTSMSTKMKKKKKAKPTNRNSKVDSLGPITDWVCVRGIPALSNLDDLLRELSRVMTVESKLGIVDLDKAESILQEQLNNKIPEDVATSESLSPPSLPLWNPGDTYPNFEALPDHMVLEAHMMLSTLGRPNGWFLRLANRSCVHALLSHIAEAKRIYQEESPKLTDSTFFPWKKFETRPLLCGGQALKVEPFYPTTSIGQYSYRYQSLFHNSLKWGLGDHVIRVENCIREATEEDVTAFFSRFELLDERKDMPHVKYPLKAVQLIVQGSDKNNNFAAKTAVAGRRDDEVTHSATSTFIVRFATPANARSAVREKQNVEFMGRRLRLAQYSRQIFLSPDI